MKTDDTIQRSVLPIPDVPRVDFTTYDAKDPETNFPPPTAAAAHSGGIPEIATSARRATTRCFRIPCRRWRER